MDTIFKKIKSISDEKLEVLKKSLKKELESEWVGQIVEVYHRDIMDSTIEIVINIYTKEETRRMIEKSKKLENFMNRTSKPKGIF